MAVGPSDESIGTFTAITSLPRENAVAWLQANNNEVDKATNAFFDSGSSLLPPKAPTVQWEERDFHADKSGDSQQNPGLTNFSVHPPDTLNANVFGGLSRPPSRVSNREGRSGAQQYEETEDEQLNRAMAISLSESQTLPGQETGVADLNKQAFGPAQREYYDTGQWSLTIPGSHTQEILLNPEPIDRKRQPGVPAFFKPSPDAPHLSALIKILHEIPRAREALLNTEFLAPDYGHDSQWWDGEPIKQLRVVNVDQGYHDAYSQDLLNETQRLMAFLDGTERAYGSIDGITKLQGRHPDKERIAVFLDDWQRATCDLSPGEPLRIIFESRGARRDPEEGDDKYQSFTNLPVNLRSDLVDSGFSLYNALDEVIWEEADGPEVFLKEIGNVVIFNVTCWNTSGSGIGIDVPATWYPDRYLESSIQQARRYLDRKGTLARQQEELEMTKEKLLKFNTADASSMLAKAMEHFQQTSAYRSKPTDRVKVNGSMDTDTSVLPNNVLEQLKILDGRIAAKLKSLEKAKEELAQLGKENSSFYTTPTNNPETCPTQKYTLRGVATTPSTCYVLEKMTDAVEDDLIDMEDIEWQWWKLEYISSDSKPVLTLKVTEEEVLEAARSESPSVLLVYADDLAISHKSTPLPTQLANFIRADNLSFQAELNDFLQTTRESPGKRKALSDDQDDLVTEHPRSPPFSRDQFRDSYDHDPADDSQLMHSTKAKFSSQLMDNDLSINPPDYDDSPPSPSPMQSIRPLNPQKNVEGSSDNNIPVSFRAMDHAHMSLNQDGLPHEAQEMQERRTRTSLFQGSSNTNGGYQLGDYVPEIKMEDDDDDDDDEEEEAASQKARNEGPSQAHLRGAWGDTW